jgi:cytochrome c2
MLREKDLSPILALLLVISASALAGCAGGGKSAPLGTATFTPIEQQGAQLFSQYCISCHSRIPEEVIVGPSMAGIGERAANRVEGMEAREYIRASVMQPNAYVVEGFEELMPVTLAQELSEEELNAIIAYLMTLDD